MLLIATDSASHLSLATYCIVNAVLPATTARGAVRTSVPYAARVAVNGRRAGEGHRPHRPR